MQAFSRKRVLAWLGILRPELVMASRTVVVTLAVSQHRYMRPDVCRGHGEKDGPHVV